MRIIPWVIEFKKFMSLSLILSNTLAGYKILCTFLKSWQALLLWFLCWMLVCGSLKSARFLLSIQVTWCFCLDAKGIFVQSSKFTNFTMMCRNGWILTVNRCKYFISGKFSSITVLFFPILLIFFFYWQQLSVLDLLCLLCLLFSNS